MLSQRAATPPRRGSSLKKGPGPLEVGRPEFLRLEMGQRDQRELGGEQQEQTASLELMGGGTQKWDNYCCYCYCYYYYLT